jgi:hypothetical protein
MNDQGDLERTGRGLLRFLDFAITKGYLKGSTGQAMKTASREVLSTVEGDGWESFDLSEIDVDELVARFERKRMTKYSVASLNAYKGRFARAVAMFAEYHASPGAWRPNVRQRTRPSTIVRPSGSTAATPDQVLDDVPEAERMSPGLIRYPFPLRPNVVVTVELPVDLSSREAQRLSAFISALAIDGQQALPAGSPD